MDEATTDNGALDPDLDHAPSGTSPTKRPSPTAWAAKWKDLFTILGVVGGLVGLVFITIQVVTARSQLSHVRDQLESGASQTVDSQLLDLDKTLSAQPALQVRSCFVREPQGPPCPVTAATVHSPTEQATLARGLAILHLDIFDSVYSQANFLHLRDLHIDRLDPGEDTSDGWTGWSNYMVNTMQASPVMCAVLRDHATEYTKNFVDDLLMNGCAVR